jgi:hypothetical protein
LFWREDFWENERNLILLRDIRKEEANRTRELLEAPEPNKERGNNERSDALPYCFVVTPFDGFDNVPDGGKECGSKNHPNYN